MIDSSCLTCQGHGPCPSCGNQNDTINLPFHPVHRNSYTYNTPQNLMYPEGNMDNPGGTICWLATSADETDGTLKRIAQRIFYAVEPNHVAT